MTALAFKTVAVFILVHDYPFISVLFYQNTVCVTKSIGDGWCSVCLIGGGNLILLLGWFVPWPSLWLEWVARC